MGWLTDVFGERPEVAKFHKLDVSKEQGKSILGNIGNFEDIKKLGELYKQYMVQQQNELLPGYSDTLALGQKSAQDLLRQGDVLAQGQIPDDVKAQIQRSDAYTSLMGGYGGSGMSRSLTARDLGLTSLDLMRQGASMIGQGGNSAQQWAGLARGDMMNPASMFTTPQETANFDLQNAVLKQQSQQFAYNVAAAPSPGAAGISNTLMGVLGMYLGGGMGGGGGLMQGGKTSVPLNAGMSSGSMADNWWVNAGGLGG